MRQRKIGRSERRPGAVDPIEDLYHLFGADVVAGDLIDGVGIGADLAEPAQAPQIAMNDPAAAVIELVAAFEQSLQPFAQKLVDADPRRIVLHAGLLPEAKLLGLGIEVEIEEQRFSFVEPRRFALEQHVERGQALLSVEEQQGVAVARRLAVAYRRRLVGAPDQQMAGRMLSIERLDQPAHLIAVPDVAALELRQQNLTATDLIQQFADRFHFMHARILP